MSGNTAVPSQPKFRGRLGADLRECLPHVKVHTIFDVGANIGQTAARMRKSFPDATIHSFEPISHTYQRLRDNVSDDDRIHCHKLAFSSQAGTGLMRSRGTSTGNALVKEGQNHLGNVESVRLMSGDQFCKENGISNISFLKIDTEGHDLKVLLGFFEHLREHAIDIVQVEASMNPRNDKHIAFFRFYEFFEMLGYRLLYIYDQVLEKTEFELRRANPVFVAEKVAGGARR